jgi:hypothetical protein
MAGRVGARSQAAHLVFSGVVLLVLLFLTGPLQYRRGADFSDIARGDCGDARLGQSRNGSGQSGI